MLIKNKNYTNITDILVTQAQMRPDLKAVDTSKQSFTYSELNILVSKTAQFLYKHNIKTADVVASDLDDQLTYIISMLALAKIGATLFSISKDTPNILYKKVLQKTNSTIILTDSKNKKDTDLPTLLIDLEVIKNISIPLTDTVYAQRPDAPWQIILGSGSTGRQKLIPVTHSQEISRTECSADTLPITEDDRVSSLIAINFSDTRRRFLETIYSGATFVILDLDTLTKKDLKEKYKLTVLRSTVFHIEKILNSVSPNDKGVFDFLKILSIGTASVSDTLRERIYRHLTSNLFITYGTNETGTLTVANLCKDKSISCSVGHPDNDVTIEVVNKHNIPLKPGEIGLIRTKTPGMIHGYLGDNESTQSPFKEDWFYPGDVGKFSVNGELIYLGRTDNMMIYNGINIYPAEIEKTLMSHPDVRDAVAIPLKSTIHQDIPVCTVTLNSGSCVTESQLMQYAYQRLGISSPRKVIVLDHIPHSKLGKIDYKKIYKKIQLKLDTSKQPGQTRQTIRVKLDKKIPTSLKHIDDWLLSVLDLELNPSTSNPTVAFIDRILLLNMTLLQSIRIPVFDPGEVITVDISNTNFYSVSISLAYIDHIPENIFLKSIKFSSDIIFKFFPKEITSQNIQQLYRNLEKEFIEPFKKISGSGKSTIPILREAYRKNIPFMHLMNGVYQLGWGSNARRVSRSATEFDSTIGTLLSHDKMVASSLARDAGLPAPVHIVVGTQKDALSAAKKLGWPIVIKPADQDRGEGVTVDISDERSLIIAFQVAFEVSKTKRIIVERHVNGVCCRIFIADDQMLYAVKRLPKAVRGNGVRNIKELIINANKKEERLPPWKKTESFPLDKMAEKSISDAGFTLNSVPKENELVPLRRIESTQWGGTDEDVTKIVHKDNIDLARKAARLFRLNVAGIDIITSDISIPWHQNGAIVNEVNYSPQYGGGEISKRSIPLYLSGLIKSDGRIPIMAIVGGDEAMELALKQQKEYTTKKIRSFVTSHISTILRRGEEEFLASRSLNERVKSILMDSKVDTLIIVVQTDEFLHRAIPVDTINNLIVSSKDLHLHDKPEESLSNKKFDLLLLKLRKLLKE